MCSILTNTRSALRRVCIGKRKPVRLDHDEEVDAEGNVQEILVIYRDIDANKRKLVAGYQRIERIDALPPTIARTLKTMPIMVTIIHGRVWPDPGAEPFAAENDN